MRTAWCAWSNRALRAVQLMAREWYHCEDLSQLHHYEDPCQNGELDGELRDKGEVTSVVGDDRTHNQNDTDGIELLNASYTSEIEKPNTYDDASWSEMTAHETDPFAFLFDDTTINQSGDNEVREWITEQGYDLFNTGF